MRRKIINKVKKIVGLPLTYEQKLCSQKKRLVAKYAPCPQSLLVSIIMPVWNREGVIGKAIDSVLCQSYRNFELIIIDDGSTDGTMQVVKSQDDSRIDYTRVEKGGVSRARNIALHKSKGDIIAYLDSDNRWHPDFLLIMVNKMVSSNKKIAYCGMRIIDVDTNKYKNRLYKFDYNSIKKNNLVDLNVFVHKRILYEKNGGFNESMTRLVDWELVLRYTKDCVPLVVECVLADYYIDSENRQISQTERVDQNMIFINRLIGGHES